MAKFYCDHENTTLYPSAYLSTPSGPSQLPQEGDGKAKGTGTAPASSSASWDLTSASATSGTMTIMGATVTGLNGSGATLASAIATAINASTAEVTAATGNITSVYLKALVWAAASGATLTVYSRIASADLNYSASTTACQMAVGTGWTGAPAAAQFSGGVSGPWRYWGNATALAAAVSGGVSGAVTTYGAFKQTVMTTGVAGDICVVRTKRGGSNISCAMQTSSYCDYASTRVIGFLFDDGTEWTNDDGQFQFSLASTHGSVGNAFCLTNSTGGIVNGNGQRLRVTFQPIAYNFLGAVLASNTNGNATHFDSVLFDISNAALSGAFFSALVNTNYLWAARRCKFLVSKFNAFTANQFGFFRNATNGSGHFIMEDCDVVFTGLTGSPSGRLFSVAKGQYHQYMLVRNVRIYDQNDPTIRFPLADFLVLSGASEAGQFVVQMENVSGLSTQPGDMATSMVGSVTPVTYRDHRANNCIHIDSGIDGAFREEYLNGTIDWTPGEGRPTLAAMLPSGTPYSLRALWYGQYLTGYPAFFHRFAQFNRLAAAVRTIKLEMLFSGDITPATVTSDAVYMTVSYVDSTGVIRHKTSFLPAATPVELAAGSASWDKSGGGGAYSAYFSKKIEVTTDYAIKNDTLIDIVLHFAKNCPAAVAGKYVFIDPEFSVA